MPHLGQEKYKDVRNGQFVTLHRCRACYRTKVYVHESGASYADDNGFYPADQPYPHWHHCENRDKF